MSLKFFSKNILVVEDSKLTNHLITDKLSNAGHTVKQAYTLEEAVSHLKKESFDFVTVDLVLPDGNGEELIKRIKKEYPKTKTVVFTANDSLEDRNKLFQYGIVDYFLKDDLIDNSMSEILAQIQKIDRNLNYTILIVDSSSTEKAFLKTILKARNYSVKAVKSAEEALVLLDSFDISLIITDIKLRSMNGLEFIRRMKKSQYSYIPIAVFSSIDDPEIAKKSYKLKAVEFLNKPSSAEEILLKVDFWIENSDVIKKLNNSNKLLAEYKDAIDESSIVSKANVNGFITYVNDAFCAISGYEKEELIGNNHNMLRHIDTPKEVFEDLWGTITNKKAWHGILKNRRKDGSHYWVKSTIKPILDADGDIVEYISIRNDITELQDYKFLLDDALEEKEQTLEEHMNYIVQYENAVSKSNAIVRTGVDFRITYVNENFTKLTGFSVDEMFGKFPVEFNKDNVSINEVLYEIEKNNIHTDTYKGITKTGKPYFAISTIAPILNNKGETLEYLIIKHDITDKIKLAKEIEETQKEVVFTMGAIGETRSKETGLHVKRVAEYSYLLAKLHGLKESEAQLIKQASPMHDIGKVAIPDDILNKPGKLTEEEFEIMKQHSELGYNMLKASKRPILKTASMIARYHHEKWDGSGYPQGLKGEEIDISARITAIADVFDALGHDRVYKKAWPLEKILELFKEESGKHFDPNLVNVFMNNLDKFLEIAKRLDD